jgi:carboxyl-terminal processing protease
VTQFQERTGEDVAKSINKLFEENKKPLDGLILDYGIILGAFLMRL